MRFLGTILLLQGDHVGQLPSSATQNSFRINKKHLKLKNAFKIPVINASKKPLEKQWEK